MTSAHTSRPGAGEDPGRDHCRAIAIDASPAPGGILLAACTWQATLAVGVPLEQTAAYRRYAEHTCIPRGGLA